MLSKVRCFVVATSVLGHPRPLVCAVGRALVWSRRPSTVSLRDHHHSAMRPNCITHEHGNLLGHLLEHLSHHLVRHHLRQRNWKRPPVTSTIPFSIRQVCFVAFCWEITFYRFNTVFRLRRYCEDRVTPLRTMLLKTLRRSCRCCLRRKRFRLHTATTCSFPCDGGVVHWQSFVGVRRGRGRLGTVQQCGDDATLDPCILRRLLRHCGASRWMWMWMWMWTWTWMWMLKFARW